MEVTSDLLPPPPNPATERLPPPFCRLPLPLATNKQTGWLGLGALVKRD
ncbi:hypothetical protein FLM9_212 [Candidatus Synechococcus spongiarum]|uniref:Uncharacterized protein n=1 Tax=Candidatus Synechococcus spongiarum TaxID=431041 RepID=A0A171DEV1_9SYNE|nr:hypothetical protein FLM9_212 [Candidatus Synechococcus spongiarum]